MKFYLGAHHPNWLGTLEASLFVSHRWLKIRRTFPRALRPWALDSGGFTEFSTYGEWRTTPAEYIEGIARYAEEVGSLDWCAPQDWMCEPMMLARTGLSIPEHQQRTTDNLLDLRWSQPDAPVIPVLQGWTTDDYLRHADAYAAAGIDLTAEPTVGVGTVCRRQHTAEAAELLTTIASQGIAVHGFGLKMSAVKAIGPLLTSADSMAWSYNARRNPRLPGCTTHRTCANCPLWAMQWRSKLLAHLEAAT